MKNKLFIPALAISFAIFPFTASAQSTTTRPVKEDLIKMREEAKKELEERKKELDVRKEEFKKEIEEKRNEMEKKREEIRGEIEKKKEEVKSEIEKKREENISKIQERVFKFTQNVLERYNAAIERVVKIAERIDSRIAKMKTENIDTKKAEDLMVVAKIKIETAKTSVAGIKLDSQMISSSTATTTPEFKADFQKLRTQLDKAKADIKAAHVALVDVIANLKPGYNRATTTKQTATTTTASSTNP